MKLVHLFFVGNSQSIATAQVFNEDITGPHGSAIEVTTAINGSFDDLSGNFTLLYGTENATWPLPFNATADEVEEALEVRNYHKAGGIAVIA